MSKRTMKAKIRSTASRRNKPESNPNEIKTKLLVSPDFKEEVKQEILDVLAETKFNKISIPLGTYRYLVEDNVAEDDNRIITVGYIKKYNPSNQEFTVILFNNMRDIIKEMGNLTIELLCTMFGGHLGTITKFNIIPVEEDVQDEDSELDECVEEMMNDCDDEGLSKCIDDEEEASESTDDEDEDAAEGNLYCGEEESDY